MKNCAFPSILAVLSLLTLMLLALSAGPALAQCGHPPNCNFPSHITVCPSGDFMVTGQVRDVNGNPCIGSTVHMQFHPPAVGTLWVHPAYPFPVVSATTNLTGTVTFQPMMGGCSPGGFVTFFDNAGVVLGQANTINSPDINGDGIVNLSDVTLLARAFYNGYTPCADLNMDGAITLSDVTLFSRHMNH